MSRRVSRRALLAGAVGLGGAAAGVAAYELARDGAVETLQNEFLRIDLDAATGAIVGLGGVRTGLDLVATPRPRSPWRILLGNGSVLERPASFELEREDGGAVLRWSSGRGHELEATIELAEGEPSARFTIALEGPGAEVVEYPRIRGIGRLSEADRLLHAHATGFLFRDPFDVFAAEGDGPARGLLYSPYPESYSGAALQLMAYYAEGRGGFAFSVEDATGAQKWLNFFKAEGGDLEAAFMHGSPDVERDRLEPGYPVVVGALEEGTWTEAADRYKSWAVRQPWCAAGPLEEREDAPRWLHEDIGLVVFGVNASHDRTPWIEELHRIAGTPVLHLLGPNWAKADQDYRDNIPGGLADWFPARFANTDAIREQGDRFAPLEFDLLFGIYHSDHEEGIAALQAIPTPILSFDAYGFPYLCPTTSFLRELHRERDARLGREYGADGIYYDISANNVIKQCFNGDHGHPRGGGAFMTQAYRDLYAESRAAVGGPLGTEMMNEVFVDRLDFFQARAEASPAAAFEGDQFRDWIKAGSAEKVPLFAYVYHEYGPVRTDGWGKLSAEQGELFYWIAARVLAWGGIFQLNYEYSPLEDLEGTREPLDEHYWPLVRRPYRIDPEKAAFVGEIARARAGFANRYLAYGTMLPPLRIESPTVELDWFHYNCPQTWPAYEDSGTQAVAAVVHAAWRHGDRAGVVLVNVDRAEHEVSVPLGIDALRLPAGPKEVEYVTAVQRRPLGRTGEEARVTLPPRKVALLEVVPA